MAGEYVDGAVRTQTRTASAPDIAMLPARTKLPAKEPVASTIMPVSVGPTMPAMLARAWTKPPTPPTLLAGVTAWMMVQNVMPVRYSRNRPILVKRTARTTVVDRPAMTIATAEALMKVTSTILRLNSKLPVQR